MKQISKKIIGILLIIIMLTFQSISLAVTQSDIDNKKQEQNNISNQEKEIEKKKEEIEAKKSDTLKQVQALSTQINGYQSEIDKLDSEIDEANLSIKEQEIKLQESQKNYEIQNNNLQDRIVASYENGEISFLNLLFGSEDLVEFISYYYLISEVAEYDKELLQDIENQKKEIENAKKELEASKEILVQAKTSKESVATQLKDSKAQKDKYVSQLSDEEKKLEAELSELQEANRRIQNEIIAAQKAYEEELKKLQNNQPNVPAGSGFFIKPTSGSITARAYYSSGRFHGAIDYGVSVGTPVYAAATGVVMSTANLSGSYGTYVVIRHANGLQSYYAHGTYGSICVKAGQTVSQGQKIMLSGNTGNSSGPHLHFEVRKAPYSYNSYATAYGQDSRVDPSNYM